MNDNILNTDTKEKLKVYIRESKYDGNLPFFYSDNMFPQLEQLKINWRAIRDEIINYEKQNGNITGLNTYSPPELSSNISWSNIYLENFLWRFHKNRKYFPITCKLLNQIPDCTLAAISILSPHSEIKPHYGDTNGIIRCHLGLVIPESYPICGIRVGDEEKGWKEGEFVFFTEAHLHTTWNNSSERRYLLVIDIIARNVSENVFDLCSKVLGAQTFNFFEKRYSILKNISDRNLKIIHFFLSGLWRVYLPIQRRLKFL